MKTKTSLFIGAALAVVVLCFTGCNFLDKAYVQKPGGAVIGTNIVVIPAVTNTVVAPVVTNTVIVPPKIDLATGIVVPGSTNITVTGGSTFVTITPASTNFVPVLAPPTLETNSMISGGISMLGSLPVPGAGAAALALGWLYSAYAAIRNKKVSVALVQGIEAGRQILQTTPEGQKLDAKVKDALLQHQDIAGVLNEVSGLVNAYTGDTVKPA